MNILLLVQWSSKLILDQFTRVTYFMHNLPTQICTRLQNRTYEKIYSRYLIVHHDKKKHLFIKMYLVEKCLQSYCSYSFPGSLFSIRNQYFFSNS